MPLNQTDIKLLKKHFLTKKQFDKSIEQVVKLIEEKNKTTKKELHTEISHLPTKDEFYAETSKIYKKLEDIETEKNIIMHHQSDHEDRITTLEHKAEIIAN